MNDQPDAGRYNERLPGILPTMVAAGIAVSDNSTECHPAPEYLVIHPAKNHETTLIRVNGIGRQWKSQAY